MSFTHKVPPSIARVTSSLKRKNFIVRNEGFVCEKCGEKNPVATGTCRNHCRRCLFSKHVDDEIPGDRESRCGGFMEPINFDYRGDKGHMLVHHCIACGKTIKNMLAEDDNLNEFSKITLSTRDASLSTRDASLSTRDAKQ